VHVLVRDLDGGLALVRLAAGEELVQQHARGVDVGPRVGGAVGDQLGRDVGHGADEHATGRGVGGGGDRSNQPEVRHLHPAVVGDKDVLGLDVAVHEAGVVRGRQRRQDRLQQRQRVRRGKRSLVADDVAKGASRDVLHGQEERAVVLALVEHAHHVRV
jgi:hypothetical protein